MTESKTSLFKGTRCRICTGCGRCVGSNDMHIVTSFRKEEVIKESLPVGDAGEAFFACNKNGAYIVTVDIGTTTIAMQLREKDEGTIMDTYTCLNPQREFGADVLSRIQAASDCNVRERMKEAAREAVYQGIERFRKKVNLIEEIRIAANTTMIHLFMGYDVSGLGHYPFETENLSEIHTILWGIPVLILPGVSAFVGADIVAGITALSMAEQEAITLLLDLGTNGEMVLGNKDKLLATSTAAGPAFEGNADCYGADLMALVARLLEDNGILDEMGLLAEPYFTEGITIGGVKITQQYIRQLQMAKAAICSGIEILCKKYGIYDYNKISKVYLAGGMGFFLDPMAAAKLGLYPYELAGKTVAVGNAALEGAFLYGKEGWGAKDIEVINLATEKEFQETYIRNMNLSPC